MSSIARIICLFFLAIQLNAEGTEKYIMITVLNHKKEPINNVCLFYKLESYRDRNTIGLPIEPADIQVKRFEKYTTNDKGVVIIPIKKVSLKKNEQLITETLFINLDLVEEDRVYDFSGEVSFFNFPEWYSSDKEKKKLINVCQEYKGLIRYNVIRANSFNYPEDVKYTSSASVVDDFFQSRSEVIFLENKND